MCFKDVLNRIRAAGLSVTEVQVRYAISRGKVSRPELDGSLRFDFRPEHLEELMAYFRAVAVSRNGVAARKAVQTTKAGKRKLAA